MAVISSKDCWFLKRALPSFIHGLGCINGIEIVASGYITIDEVAVDNSKIDVLESIVLTASKLGVKVEVKRSMLGRVAGISLDWKNQRSRPREIDYLVLEAKKRNLFVIEYPGLWFLDIYPSNRNKGDALRVLKSLLGINRVVYLGDSVNDLPAFAEADIGILVEHEFNKRFYPANVKHRVRFEKLAEWLNGGLSELVYALK